MVYGSGGGFAAMMYEAMPKSSIQVTSHQQPLFLLILPQHHAEVFISRCPIEFFLRGRIHQIIDGI